jgi:hypothetical protein
LRIVCFRNSGTGKRFRAVTQSITSNFRPLIYAENFGPYIRYFGDTEEHGQELGPDEREALSFGPAQAPATEKLMGESMTICKVLFRTGLAAYFLSVLCISLLAAEAENRPRKSAFVIGGGAGIPGEDLGKAMSPSFLMRFGYGYRPHRFFQVEIGADCILHAAGISTSEQTFIGEIRKMDNEYLIPFGARFLLPVSKRFEFFAGGGGSYIWYGEEADIPGLTCSGSGCIYSVPCPGCISRSGWGLYGTAGFNISLESRNRFWLGLETRYFRGGTSGRLLGNGLYLETTDQWFNPSINLVFRF